jgi:hypothetical protein
MTPSGWGALRPWVVNPWLACPWRCTCTRIDRRYRDGVHKTIAALHRNKLTNSPRCFSVIDCQEHTDQVDDQVLLDGFWNRPVKPKTPRRPPPAKRQKRSYPQRTADCGTASKVFKPTTWVDDETG